MGDVRMTFTSLMGASFMIDALTHPAGLFDAQSAERLAKVGHN
jgi:hypothetical protein